MKQYKVGRYVFLSAIGLVILGAGLVLIKLLPEVDGILETLPYLLSIILPNITNKCSILCQRSGKIKPPAAPFTVWNTNIFYGSQPVVQSNSLHHTIYFRLSLLLAATCRLFQLPSGCINFACTHRKGALKIQLRLFLLPPQQ